MAADQGLKQLDRIASPTRSHIEPEITMLPVCSSMAAKIGYDVDREILAIEFNSGGVYQYSAVEAETWTSLQLSDSIGEFYHNEIKGNYRSQKIE